MEVVLECAKGKKQCETTRKGKIYRCRRYIRLAGRNQLDETVDEYRCLDEWIPVLLIEIAKTNRGQTEAIMSMRDESIKRQDVFASILTLAQEVASKSLQPTLSLYGKDGLAIEASGPKKVGYQQDHKER